MVSRSKFVPLARTSVTMSRRANSVAPVRRCSCSMASMTAFLQLGRCIANVACCAGISRAGHRRHLHRHGTRHVRRQSHPCGCADSVHRPPPDRRSGACWFPAPRPAVADTCSTTSRRSTAPAHDRPTTTSRRLGGAETSGRATWTARPRITRSGGWRRHRRCETSRGAVPRNTCRCLGRASALKL